MPSYYVVSDSYRFSWEQIQKLCHLRRRYVQLYADSLQQLNVDNSEIRGIEKDLDPKIILLWRYVHEVCYVYRLDYINVLRSAHKEMIYRNSLHFPACLNHYIFAHILKKNMSQRNA